MRAGEGKEEERVKKAGKQQREGIEVKEEDWGRKGCRRLEERRAENSKLGGEWDKSQQ